MAAEYKKLFDCPNQTSGLMYSQDSSCHSHVTITLSTFWWISIGYSPLTYQLSLDKYKNILGVVDCVSIGQ